MDLVENTQIMLLQVICMCWFFFQQLGENHATTYFLLYYLRVIRREKQNCLNVFLSKKNLENAI